MSSKIYYFSGTGNSLAVSRKLNESLAEKGSIVPLSMFEEKQTVDVAEDVLGFVFPVYFMNIPDVVKHFIEKLNFKTNSYIFAIAACNGIAGNSLFTLNKCLNKKGRELSSGFVIDMPGNAFVTLKEIEVERLKVYAIKVTKIANCINERRVNGIEGKYNFNKQMESLVMGVLAKKFQFSPKKYLSTSECVGCGVCEKVCPVKNIKMVDGQPQWGNKCASCLACFHWCPKKAIVINKFLMKRNRYHHPEISVTDMELREYIQ